VLLHNGIQFSYLEWREDGKSCAVQRVAFNSVGEMGKAILLLVVLVLVRLHNLPSCSALLLLLLLLPQQTHDEADVLEGKNQC